MSDASLPARQVAIREHLIAALHADLVGPMAEDETLSSAPSRWYLTGFLVPSAAPEDQRIDPLAADTIDQDTEDDAPDDDVQPVRSFLPSSMGLSFLLPPGCETLEVEVSWGDYDELSEEETRELREAERARWRGDEEASPREDEAGDDAEKLRFRYWRRVRTFSRVVAVQLDAGTPIADIPGGGGVHLRWIARRVRGGALEEGARAVSLFLVNGREPLESGASNADERSIFHARLEVRSRGGFLPRHRQVATDHPDDRRNDLQFRDHAEWAVGHGVATEATVEDGACRTLATTWLPRAAVYRMKATHVEGVLLGMDALAALPDAETLRQGMAPLLQDYRRWIEAGRGRLDALSPARQETARGLLAEAELALGRMDEGIAVLGADPDALQAFRIANAAMATAARKARPNVKNPSWRLFQLAFVLLNLVGTTHPTHPDRDRVDLLFFPTGGGKTEAYLGVAAYVLALRRLRGRDRPDGGAGVAVLLRYTLRLLTLDQLRRAAQLICALELQRRARPEVLGTTRFSIGLWVGRNASANRLKDVAKVVRRLKDSGRVWGGPPPVPLATCPWCDTAITPDSHDLVPDDRHPKALTVGCADLECPFSYGADPHLPAHQDGLPIVVVDEQVYRELPSILVGTVDKFASLPWRGAVGSLFGRVRALGTYGFYGAHETPTREATPLRDGIAPPELIIQDELHLITGPLGTMVGLYETAIDALCRDQVGYGPKILASTATARRATEQIQALFARSAVHLFPPQGPDDGDTFFATLDRRPEKARIYVGVAAPGRSAKVLAARTYTALLGSAQRHWSEAGPPGPHNPGDTYMTLVAYFNALKELGGAQRLVQEDVAQRTERLDRRAPVGTESAHFARRHLSFDVLELTSRQSTDDVARAIDRLNQSFSTGRGSKTDVLLASSMISVGVDISRLGLMVVNGQPKTTAEYIQASSRVGRDTPGLVVTALNLFKPRDRSHYERFTAYHESFYREVEAASVTPFSARAVDRGLAGLMVGLARHLGPKMAENKQVDEITLHEGLLAARLTELLVHRARAHRDGVPPSVLENLEDRVVGLLKNWKHLVTELKTGSGHLRYSPWEDPPNFTALLSTAVDALPEQHEALEAFRAPTSMRDVEPGVHVWVDLKPKEGRK